MTIKAPKNWQAWGVSLVVHLGVLVVLGWVTFSITEFQQAFYVESRIGQELVAPEPFLPNLPVEQLFSQNSSALRGPELDEFLQSAPMTTGLNPPVTVGPASGDGGIGLGGDGTLPGETSVGFFGTRSVAKSVVFIVDMSGSMEGTRFPRAQYELSRAIHQLHVTQRYYVFFFNDKTIPLFYPHPAQD